MHTTHELVHTVLTDLDLQRFDSVDQPYGGHSDEVPPVPIPNTEVKLVCVLCSTGVGDPLGVTVRRPYSYGDPLGSLIIHWPASNSVVARGLFVVIEQRQLVLVCLLVLIVERLR